MIKLSQIAAAAALALSFGGAQAAYVIDSFSTPAQPNISNEINDITTDGNGVFAAPVFSATILGGSRDQFISKQGDLSDDGGSGVSSNVFNGTWRYSEQTGQDGRGVTRWDGAGTSVDADVDGLGGLNLLGYGNAFAVDVIRSDVNLLPLTFFAWTNTSLVEGVKSYVMSSVLVNASGSGTYVFNFSDFIGANFADVGALELQVNGGQNGDADAQIDMVSVVPEPGTLALAGIALLGLGAIRRRKS